ncbi:hypothetical protein MRX96_052691 [Rhipicephalus microplus]
MERRRRGSRGVSVDWRRPTRRRRHCGAFVAFATWAAAPEFAQTDAFAYPTFRWQQQSGAIPEAGARDEEGDGDRNTKAKRRRKIKVAPIHGIARKAFVKRPLGEQCTVPTISFTQPELGQRQIGLPDLWKEHGRSSRNR